MHRADLRIDQLDERTSFERHLAAQCAIALTAAVAINAREDLSITVAETFFMREGDTPGPLHLRSLNDLSSESFSWTPPSLTIYGRDGEPWRNPSMLAPIERSSGQQAVPCPERCSQIVVPRSLFQER